MNDTELLNKIFYKDNNYDSIDNLYKKAKIAHPSITKNFVKEWLSLQQVAQTNNNQVEKREFLPIYSETPYSFQIDLTFLKYKKQNDGNYVLFTAINVNTRYAYAYYAKDKLMSTILSLLKRMEKKTVINSITCDKGTEFVNSDFIKYCNDENISLYFVKADGHKLGIINRFHRTLKSKIDKHFVANDTVRYIDVLDKIISNYNNTVNTGIGYKPNEVSDAIENQIVNEKKQETIDIQSKLPEIKVGDYCRIRNKKGVFDKEGSKYSVELYRVIKVSNNSVIIKDDKNEYKLKKSDIKIVKNPIKQIESIVVKKADLDLKIERKLKKANIDQTLVIEGGRIRRPRVITSV
jgi:hypothetical protein